MEKCSFCKKDLEKHRALMFVKTDGKIKWFCSSKCEKNDKMRIPRKVRWVKKGD